MVKIISHFIVNYRHLHLVCSEYIEDIMLNNSNTRSMACFQDNLAKSVPECHKPFRFFLHHEMMEMAAMPTGTLRRAKFRVPFLPLKQLYQSIER